jgi:hypothetical protein
VPVLPVLLAFARLRRTWPDAAQPASVVLPLAAAVTVTAMPAPAAARRGAAALSTLRAEPYRLPEPERQGTLFQLAGWPVAATLGDPAAVRVVAAVAAGSALLLVYALVRSAALPPAAALIGQAGLPAAPMLALGPGAAVFDHALPLAFTLLLLAHLVRRLPFLEGARDNAAAFAYLLLAQATGPATTLETLWLVVLLASAEAVAGGRRRALRLATTAALATAVVLAARYAPLLLGWPARVAEPAPLPSLLVLALAALVGGLGLALLPQTTWAPRVLAAALLAGLFAAVIGRRLPACGGAAAGVGLLAPVAACALAACVARFRSPTTAAAPGSRSSPSTR